MFKNLYTRENITRISCEPGSPFYEKKGWTYDDDGEHVFVTKEVIDTDALIQAARDSVDLKLILERYQNGDETALDKVKGMYIDAYDMPKSYAEMFRSVENAKAIFDAMPVEVKESYDNSPVKFWQSSGTKEFDDSINSFRADFYAKRNMIDPSPINTVKAAAAPVAAAAAVESEVSNE